MSVMSRLGRRAADEQGGALVAVIGMMVVAGIVAASVATSTVVAVGRTTTTRAAVQSEAAAETGVNVAELGLRTAGDCLLHGGVYTGSNPTFSAQVSYYNGSSWISGCPAPTLATSVKVISTGTAAALGSTNQSSANTAKIEATYAYTTATGGITATGGAVFGGGTNGLNNLTVTQTTTVTPGGTGPDVVIKNGNYTCQSGTTIKGNLIVQNGSVELNGCIVLGGISASGAVSVNSGTNSVGGNVIAAGIGLAAGVNAALVGPNSTVNGYVLAKGTVRIDGKVLGSVTGTGTGTSTISPSTRISGALALGGALDYGGLWGTLWGTLACVNSLLATLNLSCALNAAGVVLGTVATNVTSLVAPTAPTTSTWAAYSYSAAPWVAAGYTELTWTGSCTIDNNTANQVFIRQVMASTTPVVVNALGCAKLLFSNSAALQLKLNANVAFVSKSFGIENVTLDSAVGAGLKAWFIVPGPTELAQTQAKLCLDIDGHVNINSGVKVTANVSALIYTPGCIDNSATTWKGQEYAGTVNFGQNVTLDYVPVGLPGTSLDGTVAVAATPGALGARTLLRDVQR